jgi:hypothetical protein
MSLFRKICRQRLPPRLLIRRGANFPDMLWTDVNDNNSRSRSGVVRDRLSDFVAMIEAENRSQLHEAHRPMIPN